MPTIEEVASRAEVVVTMRYAPDEPLITTDRGHETLVERNVRVIWRWTEDSERWYPMVHIRGHWRLKSGEWSDTPRRLHFEPGVHELETAAIEATRPTWFPVIVRGTKSEVSA